MLVFGGCIVTENIPHYKNDPITNAATAPELKLYRPRISYWKAALYVVIHILASALLSMLYVLLTNENDAIRYSELAYPFLIATLSLFLVTLRFTFIWFVRVYQRYAKSETRLRCCMTPSCSEYAILAFKKYGAIWGSIKTFKRLLRCHPPGGIDYP